MNLTKEEEQTLLKHGKSGLMRQRGCGGRTSELQETYNRVKALKDWYPEFTKVAQRYETTAEETRREEARMVSYLTAAAYYHIGELLVPSDNKEKREAFTSMKRVYAKAAEFFPFPTEWVEIPFANTTLPGYFCRVAGITKAPAVLLLRGIDAAKEVELHIISNHFLRQGIFTLLLDLPGQGEARMRGMKMTPDFERPVGAAVDYLLKRPEVDGDRIGILGMSFSGFIAPRAAALEKRLKACVSLGGFFSLEDFEFSLSFKLHWLNNIKITDEAEWTQKRKDYSLEGVIKNLSRPLLIVNGSEDKVVPAAQSQKMYERAPGPKDIKIYDGLGHCVFYERPEALSDIATWMAEQLAKA